MTVRFISTFREFSKRGSSARNEQEHEPRTRNTGFMDKTKPHGLFLKDNFFSKLSTIRQQSLPESAYANSLKGMRIHRDRSR